MCDIKRNKARRPGQSTCCAGLWPYFPRRRVLFKLGKQDDGSLTETCFFRIHFLLQNWKGRGQTRRRMSSPCGTFGGGEAMLAGGKALADCLCRRFFRPSATSPQLPPLRSSSQPSLPACLPACLHRPLARRCEAILVTKHYAGRGHSSHPPFPPWLSGRSQRSRPAAAGSLRPAGRNLLS